jgi:hypothetical protein
MIKTRQELEKQRDALALKYGKPKRNQIVPEEILAHIRDIIAWDRTQKGPPQTTDLMVPGGW